MTIIKSVIAAKFTSMGHVSSRVHLSHDLVISEDGLRGRGMLRRSHARQAPTSTLRQRGGLELSLSAVYNTVLNAPPLPSLIHSQRPTLWSGYNHRRALLFEASFNF